MSESPVSEVPERDRRAAREAERRARRAAEIAARPAMSPTGPAPGRLRIATWNVNSLRARLDGVMGLLRHAAPDVLCLQETKASKPPDEAERQLRAAGYDLLHVGGSPYNGVAIASRHPVRDVVGSGDLGDADLDREPRVLSCVVDGPAGPIRVVSVYAPHGRTVDHWHYEYKLAFFEALAQQVRRWIDDVPRLVLCGDINVAPTDSDVFHPQAFAGLTHVTAPERAALERLLAVGLVDVDAARWGPRARRFTWWSHGFNYDRNLGMRIDLIAADAVTAASLDTTWIDHATRAGPLPSDHAALLADFRIIGAVATS